MKPHGVTVVCLLLSALVLACREPEEAVTDTGATAVATAPEPETATSATASVPLMSAVPVALLEYEIQMAEDVPAGRIGFAVTNSGRQKHSLAIEGTQHKLDPSLAPGDVRTLDITLAPGTYTLYCPVADHAGRGMRRQIVIEEE